MSHNNSCISKGKENESWPDTSSLLAGILGFASPNFWILFLFTVSLHQTLTSRCGKDSFVYQTVLVRKQTWVISAEANAERQGSVGGQNLWAPKLACKLWRIPTFDLFLYMLWRRTANSLPALFKATPKDYEKLDESRHMSHEKPFIALIQFCGVSSIGKEDF